MEWPHPHIQVPPLVAQPLETFPCLQRMAPPHVPNIAVEPFEEVGDDKGLSSFHEGYRILTMLNYYLSSIIESLKCLLMMGLQVFNNFKIVSWTKRLPVQIL